MEDRFADQGDLLALLRSPVTKRDLSLCQKNKDEPFDDTREFPEEKAQLISAIAADYYRNLDKDK